MSKLSMVNREKKRKKLVNKYSEKRHNLKEKIRQAYKSDDNSAWQLSLELQKLPRNSSPVRRNRRCEICGRPKGVYKKFGLCRICLRNYAMNGEIPGIEKSSW